MENIITSSQSQIVELGNASALTLGGYGQSTEYVRSNQHRKNQVIAIGNASVLTLGVGVSKSEGRRPFGCWKSTK
jgi:hypothetical protein